MSEFAQSADPDRRTAMRIGVGLMGLATVAAGILDLVWGNFDPGHQPIGNLGVPIRSEAIFAYIAGVWMILAGAAILWQRTLRAGAFATAAIYSIFGMFSLPLFYAMPHQYGFHVTLILGLFGILFMQFIVVGGCMVLYASVAPPGSLWQQKAPLVARWTFGLSGVLFGLAHFTNPKAPAHMIPQWMPFSASFWVLISGIGFVLAGLAILSGILNVLAARLLVLMLLIFEVILMPIIVAHPHLHQAWGGSAYNLAVAGAVLIFAASLPRQRAQ